MSPAGKFWLGILLIVIILMSFISICIPIILYLIYSIVIGVIYLCESDYNSEEFNKEFRDKLWVRSTLFFIVSYLIKSFNNFLNNKFSKNG